MNRFSAFVAACLVAASIAPASAQESPSDPAAYAKWRKDCAGPINTYVAIKNGESNRVAPQALIDGFLAQMFNRYRAAGRPTRADLAKIERLHAAAQVPRIDTPLMICYAQSVLDVPITQAAAPPTLPPAPRQTANSAPAANAPPRPAPMPVSNCVAINPGSVLYGGFMNKCAYDVYVSYCAFQPKKGAWNELFDCEKQKGGLDHIAANGVQAAHTNGTYMYWFACQAPSMPKGVKFQSGKGLQGSCF